MHDNHHAKDGKNVDDRMRQLPCRGCLRTCQLFHRCRGYPWRIEDETAANKLQPDER